MRPHDARAYLHDIIQAANLVMSFTADKTLAMYESDALLRSGVERQLAVIGEALRQALDITPDLRHRISATRQIIGLRNILIHGYANVANDIVWVIVQDDLPLLLREA